VLALCCVAMQCIGALCCCQGSSSHFRCFACVRRPAGPPPDTDNQFCPPDAENCYFMSKATANYAGASNTCLNMKGQLVSWNDYDEQLQVGRPRVGSDTQQA
jgi:hypothetical protein